MNRLLVTPFFLILFVIGLLAQNGEARKLDGFGFRPCGHFINSVPHFYNDVASVPKAKLYVIYYEGRHRWVNHWNKKLRKYETIDRKPTHGDAEARVSEVRLLYEDYKYRGYLKYDKNKVVFIDGGFRDEFLMEFWLVPDGVEPPKPTPTLSSEDIVWRKGKSITPRRCSQVYDGL